MTELKIGDVVGRKSYGGDVLFKVVNIESNGEENVVTLKGITYRIEADAPESDLEVQSDKRVDEYTRSIDNMVEMKYREKRIVRHSPVMMRRSQLKKAYYRSTPNDKPQKFTKSGRVLHIDGDNDYLETCLKKYSEFGIEAIGKYVPENEQPAQVYSLLEEYRPDILVLTGHDGVLKDKDNYLSIDSYRNSKYFIEAVKEARRYEKDYDSLVIFAGACQSMYNEILAQGANFCSSPYRVLIHALDPVMVSQKIATASVNDILHPSDVIDNTITGVKGIGGIQTRGKNRDGYPQEPYK